MTTGRFELGAAMPLMQTGPDRFVPGWASLREQARSAAEIGID